MNQSKKYDYRITQINTEWKADIIRRVSSKKSITSKSQSGFATEAEAQAWGQNEVKEFLRSLNLAEQKKRADKKDGQAE